MLINTTARHLELDPEVRLFAQERIEKLTRYVRDIREAHVVVTAEGYRHQAEITLHLKRQNMVSREEATEPRVAIDRAVDRLESQLRRLKDKRVKRKRAGLPLNGRDSQPSAADAAPSNGENAVDAESWTGEE